jgi:hypothetical protein
MYRRRALSLALILTCCLQVGWARPLHGQGAAATVELGAATPQELVARLQRAASELDFQDMAACMEPESRLEMATGLYMATVMMIAFSAMMPAMGEMMGDVVAEMAEGLGEAFGAEGTGEEARRDLAESPELAAAQQQVELLLARFNEVAARHGLPLFEEDDDEGPDPEAFETLFANVDQPRLIGDLVGLLQSMMQEMGAGENGDPMAGDNPIIGQLAAGDLTDLVIEGDHATGLVGGEPIEMVRLADRWYIRVEQEQGGFESGFSDVPPDDATPLLVGEAREEWLHGAAGAGAAWFVVTAPASGTLTVTTRGTGDGGDLVLEAFLDPDFTMAVAHSDQDLEGDRTYEVIELAVTAGQQVHVRVRQWGSGSDEVTYRLSAELDR